VRPFHLKLLSTQLKLSQVISRLRRCVKPRTAPLPSHSNIIKVAMDQFPFAIFPAFVTSPVYGAPQVPNLTPSSNIHTVYSPNDYNLFISPLAIDLASRPSSPLPNTETIIMPEKRVHFNEENIFYSRSATPSPTLSDSSLPSSSGPYTPPQFSTPLGPVQIHPLLAYHPYVFPINYDVSHTPNTASANIRASPVHLDSYRRAEPATHPPINVLSLRSDLLPWACEIHASTQSYITVEDVLSQLYRFLRTPATRDEYNAVPSQSARDKVAETYRSRCSRVSSAAEKAEELSKGLKRVDFLMGRTTFMGLSSTKLGPDAWVLNLQ
jgi:hypothetical protein